MTPEQPRLIISSTIDQLKRDQPLNEYPIPEPRGGGLLIGYGHNITAYGMPPAIADLLLVHDLGAVQRSISTMMPWVNSLDGRRQGALHNIACGMGMEEFVSLIAFLRMMKHGNYATAAEFLLKTDWAQRHGARAQRLARQIETGEYF